MRKFGSVLPAKTPNTSARSRYVEQTEQRWPRFLGCRYDGTEILQNLPEWFAL